MSDDEIPSTSAAAMAQIPALRDEEWVTLSTYPDGIQAHIAEAHLVEAGFETRILDENMAALGFGSAMGGVRLEVRGADIAAAEDHLVEISETPFEGMEEFEDEESG